MAGNRPDKVGEQIRIELSQLLARDVHDPGIGFITLTKVSVTPDLQLARVYYTSLGDEKAQKRNGQGARTAPRPSCAARSPSACASGACRRLEFFYDKSVAQHDRIEQILQDLKAEADARPPAPPDDVPHDDEQTKD